MCFFHVRFSLLGVATMVHKQIERMKRKLSEIELENAQYKARLEDGVAQAEEQRRTSEAFFREGGGAYRHTNSYTVPRGRTYGAAES